MRFIFHFLGQALQCETGERYIFHERLSSTHATSREKRDFWKNRDSIKMVFFSLLTRGTESDYRRLREVVKYDKSRYFFLSRLILDICRESIV